MLLTMPLTQLSNRSISSGTFPDSCKIAKLKPLFKMVLERIPSATYLQSPHEQTMEFIDKHKILYKFPSGFRKNHSTDCCFSYFTEK